MKVSHLVTLDTMEIAGLVVAVLAAVASGASALYALGANRRADEANRTARAALDLQARIDEREREYRDVAWEAEWDSESGLTILNSGLTDANQVTAVIRGPLGAERHDLGDLRSGESATIDSAAASAWMKENKRSMPLSPPFFIHWSSPLGVADARDVTSRTLFMLPDDFPD